MPTTGYSYKRKYELARKRARDAYEAKKDTVRATVTAGEILAGAAASGYISQSYPTFAGIPSDAALGIGFVSGGMALGQADLTALGLGMLAGYARDFGAGMAISHQASAAPAPSITTAEPETASERAAAAEKSTLSWSQGGGAGIYTR